jgi:hypothetical protein
LNLKNVAMERGAVFAVKNRLKYRINKSNETA